MPAADPSGRPPRAGAAPGRSGGRPARLPAPGGGMPSGRPRPPPQAAPPPSSPGPRRGGRRRIASRWKPSGSGRRPGWSVVGMAPSLGPAPMSPPPPRPPPPPNPPPPPPRRGGPPGGRPPEGQIAAALAGAALERSPGRMFPEEEAEMPRSDWSTLARTRRSGKYMEPAMDGRKLAWARRKSGYSPAELAAAVRTAVPGLRTRAADVLRWEAVRPTRRRRREGPSTTEGAALAELLGRPLRSFFAFRTVRIQASSWR